MQILLDSDKKIIAFASCGNLAGAINIGEEVVPEGFKFDFMSGKYLFNDGKVILNEKYVPAIEDTTIKPGLTQQAITLLAQTLSIQEQQIKSLEKSVTLLAQGGK